MRGWMPLNKSVKTRRKSEGTNVTSGTHKTLRRNSMTLVKMSRRWPPRPEKARGRERRISEMRSETLVERVIARTLMALKRSCLSKRSLSLASGEGGEGGRGGERGERGGGREIDQKTERGEAS
jgi:hypothetical protein